MIVCKDEHLKLVGISHRLVIGFPQQACDKFVNARLPERLGDRVNSLAHSSVNLGKIIYSVRHLLSLQCRLSEFHTRSKSHTWSGVRFHT